MLVEDRRRTAAHKCEVTIVIIIRRQRQCKPHRKVRNVRVRPLLCGAGALLDRRLVENRRTDIRIRRLISHHHDVKTHFRERPLPAPGIGRKRLAVFAVSSHHLTQAGLRPHRINLRQSVMERSVPVVRPLSARHPCHPLRILVDVFPLRLGWQTIRAPLTAAQPPAEGVGLVPRDVGFRAADARLLVMALGKPSSTQTWQFFHKSLAYF